MSQAALPQPAPSGPAPWRPRVAHPEADVDLVAAEEAAADLLRALGLPLGTEAMVDTPRRMAHALAEMVTAPPFDFTTFTNAEGYDEMVLVEDIAVRSVCEHHMLPITGVAHVGYLPGDRILGLSKLGRLVEHFAARPQVQERLTQQIANWLHAELRPRAVGVVLDAEHTCMTLRGVQAIGSRTVTSALHGCRRENPASRAEFFALTGVAR